MTIDKRGPTGAPGRDGVDGQDGLQGAPGKDGKNGKDGKDAEPCFLTENADGTQTLTCGDASVVIGAPCENGFPGDVTLTSDDDPDAAKAYLLFQVSGCTWVRGDINVQGYDGEELPLAIRRLEKVDGKVFIQSNENLLRAELPALKQASVLLVRWNGKLVETSTPALETASVIWFENQSLESVGEFPSLVFADVLWWTGNSKLLETPDFPVLEQVGSEEAIFDPGLIWEHNAALEKIGNFPALQSVYGGHLRGL